MLRTILRAIVYTITYPFHSSVEEGASDLPPDITPEDMALMVNTHLAMAEWPTATDDYRNPPPPWARKETDK